MSNTATYWRERQSLIADQYSSERYTAEQKRRDIACDILRQNNFTSVMDVGCGIGELLLTASRAGATKLSGCDITPVMLETTSNRLAEHNISADLFSWDIASPFSEQRKPFADLVTCFSVLPYVSDWTCFMNSVDHLLRPNGLLLVSCPNKLFDAFTLNDFSQAMFAEILGEAKLELPSELSRILDHKPNLKTGSAYTGDIHFERYTPEEIAERFKEVGLYAESTYYMNYHPVPPRFNSQFDQSELEEIRDRKERNLHGRHWSDILTHSTFMTVFRYQPASEKEPS